MHGKAYRRLFEGWPTVAQPLFADDCFRSVALEKRLLRATVIRWLSYLSMAGFDFAVIDSWRPPRLGSMIERFSSVDLR